MNRVRNEILSASLGLCVLGVARLGAAQATSNPPAATDRSGPAATGAQAPNATQSSPNSAGSGAAQSTPSTPDVTPRVDTQPGPTSSSGAVGNPDQQPVGTAGQNAQRSDGGHGTLFALIIVIAIALLAFFAFGRNRATTSRADRPR